MNKQLEYVFKDHWYHLLKYYIFDIIEPERLSWPERYELLSLAYNRYRDDINIVFNFEIVPQEIVSTHHQIMENYQKYVSQGYEGLIIRHCPGLNPTEKDILRCRYKPKRSNNLLKYKEFIDEEAEIIGGDSCVGNEDSAVRFKVRDIRGNEFFVRPRGSIEQRKLWYKNLINLIGKQLTIRYQELSEYSVPRFPVGIGIRDYE